MADGLDLTHDDIKQGLNDLCESCMTGKFTHLPFQKMTSNRSNRILEKIHTDIFGPVTPQTDRKSVV